MPAKRFVEQLNHQIGEEYAAHQQYVACAVYFASLTMPQLARFFYEQALEERGHAMMMVQYLLDSDAPVVIPGITAPKVSFEDVIEPVSLALDQERRVTGQINELTTIAREEADLASEVFMQWFIREQVEEVATMSALLKVVTRSKDAVESIEDYVLREHSGEEPDPSAPAAAGG